MSKVCVCVDLCVCLSVCLSVCVSVSTGECVLFFLSFFSFLFFSFTIITSSVVKPLRYSDRYVNTSNDGEMGNSPAVVKAASVGRPSSRWRLGNDDDDDDDVVVAVPAVVVAASRRSSSRASRVTVSSSTCCIKSMFGGGMSSSRGPTKYGSSGRATRCSSGASAAT